MIESRFYEMIEKKTDIVRQTGEFDLIHFMFKKIQKIFLFCNRSILLVVIVYYY